LEAKNYFCISSLSDWAKEDTNQHSVENVTVNSEINQIADLISAVLLFTLSETYKSSYRFKEDRENIEEDDLIFSTVNLLSNNDVLLKQLVKKWINIVGGIITLFRQ